MKFVRHKYKDVSKIAFFLLILLNSCTFNEDFVSANFSSVELLSQTSGTIAFLQDNNIYVTDPAGKNIVQSTNENTPKERISLRPNSRQVLFMGVDSIPRMIRFEDDSVTTFFPYKGAIDLGYIDNNKQERYFFYDEKIWGQQDGDLNNRIPPHDLECSAIKGIVYFSISSRDEIAYVMADPDGGVYCLIVRRWVNGSIEDLIYNGGLDIKKPLFNKEGDKLVFRDLDKIMLWDLEEDQPSEIYTGEVLSYAFNPEGNEVAFVEALDTTTIKIINAEDDKFSRHIETPAGVQSIDWK